MTSETSAPGQDPASATRPEDTRPAAPPSEATGRAEEKDDNTEDALLAYRDDSPEPPPRFGDEGRREAELAHAPIAADEDDDDEAAEVVAAVSPTARGRERGRDRDRHDQAITSNLRMAPSGEAEIEPSKLDPEALKVVFRLRQFGHEAYFVGGCVRDLLLGRTPKDFDIATSATPNEVRNVFRNCRLIGRRFRLAHVYFKGGKIIEVSTFRANPTELAADLNATNGAGAEGAEGVDAEAGEAEEDDLLITTDNVFGTAEQDARRRDFTLNGLFYDPFAGKVIDYVRGRRDLDERNIRTIGNPEIRMREDPVRILRAVRFACKCELDIESRTYAAMEGSVEDLTRCAPARLLEETFRLIRGGIATDSLKLIAALDALKLLLPPVYEYLQRAGQKGEERFYAHTRALDRRVREGEALEDAVLLAAILLPIANDAPDTEEEGKPPSVAQAIEQLLSDLVRNARLPRRIAERCRLILIAQRTLSGQRRRRGSLMSFRRHPLFNESMTVFEISVEATGEFKDQLEAWRAGAAPNVAPDAEGPKRKRRRRRRKRRTGAAEAPGAPNVDGTSAVATAVETEADEGESDEDAGPDDDGAADDEADEG